MDSYVVSEMRKRGPWVKKMKEAEKGEREKGKRRWLAGQAWPLGAG